MGHTIWMEPSLKSFSDDSVAVKKLKDFCNILPQLSFAAPWLPF